MSIVDMGIAFDIGLSASQEWLLKNQTHHFVW